MIFNMIKFVLIGLLLVSPALAKTGIRQEQLEEQKATEISQNNEPIEKAEELPARANQQQQQEESDFPSNDRKTRLDSDLRAPAAKGSIIKNEEPTKGREQPREQQQQLEVHEVPAKGQQQPVRTDEQLDKKVPREEGAKKQEELKNQPQQQQERDQPAIQSEVTKLEPTKGDHTELKPEEPRRDLLPAQQQREEQSEEQIREQVHEEMPSPKGSPQQQPIREELLPGLRQRELYRSAVFDQPESYSYSYQNEGYPRAESSDLNGIVRGQYSLLSPDGHFRRVEYVADRNGFRASVGANEAVAESRYSPANFVLRSYQPSANEITLRLEPSSSLQVSSRSAFNDRKAAPARLEPTLSGSSSWWTSKQQTPLAAQWQWQQQQLKGGRLVSQERQPLEQLQLFQVREPANKLSAFKYAQPVEVVELKQEHRSYEPLLGSFLRSAPNFAPRYAYSQPALRPALLTGGILVGQPAATTKGGFTTRRRHYANQQQLTVSSRSHYNPQVVAPVESVDTERGFDRFD